MSKVLAFVRTEWRMASAYRINTVVSLLSFVFVIVPMYFVTGALQPLMEASIRTQGGEYFAFVLVGTVALSFLMVAVSAIPSAIGRSISAGTIEALLSTPTSLPTLLAGLAGYQFVWVAIRSLVLVVAGATLGAQLVWEKAVPAMMILALIVLAYIPFGLLASAMVVAFRTSGPLARIVVTVSGLLGGVYYPTQVVPSWLGAISEVVPLTYGLRALRLTILEDAPFYAVVTDVVILSAFGITFLAASLYILSRAFEYAKRSGSLLV
jgi:ABC-2 type transport system permease protein